MASRLQLSMQLKQVIHRLWSIFLFFASIQEALHFMLQRPQELHFSSSKVIRKKEYLLIRPRRVPTGQMVLHHVLPFRQARMPITNSMARAIRVEEMPNR